MVEKILHEEKIFGNLKGEIIGDEEGLGLNLVRGGLGINLIRDNYNEDEQPYMKIFGVEAVKGLRDYLNKAILFMENYKVK